MVSTYQISERPRMRIVKVADRLVGEGQPVFIIAEIGYNFNTIEEAKLSIDAAISCGVDAVKFQTFKAETLTSRFTEFPAEAGATNQFDEFKQYEMSEELHQELFIHARERGTIVFSTPAYFDDVDLLERLEVSLYKIGSDDLTNLPLHTYIAEKGKPIIFSTGMGTLGEVDEAVRAIKSTGNDQIVILHCVSNYPIKDFSLVNLRAITALNQAFDVPVGYSDHTTTSTAAVGAVALGAKVIERHFTLDKNLRAPDCFFSADPGEMADLVRSIRELEQAMGDGVKRPTASEEAMRAETRKSTIARIPIQRGETIKESQVIVKRPGTGIPPSLAHLVPGRRAKGDIPEDTVITWDMLE